MSTAPAEVLGPVDYVLLEFPHGRFTGEASDALRNIVDSGVIRLYDLTVISKDPDGAVTVLDLTQATPDAGGFDLFAGARSNLLTTTTTTCARLRTHSNPTRWPY